MSNTLLVIQNEIRTVMGKRSFWVMTFIFPAFILALNVGMQLAMRDQIEATQTMFNASSQVNAQVQYGYVDQAGVISQLPPDVPTSLFRAFPDEAAAQAAMNSGDIARYLLVPADFPESDPMLIDPDFSPLANRQETLFEYVLTYNLVGDTAVAQTLLNPTANLRGEALQPPETAENSPSPLAAALPFVTMFIFFFLIVTGSGYMLRSISREKENRTIEVLLVSLAPKELMLGKVLGLGIVSLLQMGIWLGGGALVFNGRFDIPLLAGGINLPPNFLLWALLFFLGGYFLYSALMGIIGAMAPNAREAGQFTFVVLLPLIIPLWMNGILMQDLNSTLALVLSLVPLTAPIVMMMRLSSELLPLWQPLLSLSGVLVTAYLSVLLAARFFRADTLLSAAPINWQRLLRGWRTT